jgi:hypothetical protein
MSQKAESKKTYWITSLYGIYIGTSGHGNNKHSLLLSEADTEYICAIDNTIYSSHIYVISILINSCFSIIFINKFGEQQMQEMFVIIIFKN